MKTGLKKLKIGADHSLSGEVLRQGRLKLGITLRDFAYQLNMESGTFSQCESGKRRFPLHRLPLLPHELALEVRDALIEEFAAELDVRINSRKPPRKRYRKPTPKPLAASQPAALD